MLKCCICGRPLPNRYAVAGQCGEAGCEAVFCALHWHNGNRHCGSHGWKPEGLLDETPVEDDREYVAPEPKTVRYIEGDGATMENEEKTQKPEDGKTLRERAAKLLTREQAAGILRATLDFAGKLGKTAAGVVAKIKNANSPETLLASIDASLEQNRARRAPLMTRADALYADIVARKKAWQTAPSARKKMLELELKAMLSEYKGIERQMTAFFENENTLNTVRGRVLELMALGLRKIDEKTIDKLTDDIEDAVGESEEVSGAVRDLDKAGKRRDNENDREDFESALAGFEDLPDEAAPEASAAAADPFPVDPPAHEAPEAGAAPSPAEADLP